MVGQSNKKVALGIRALHQQAKTAMHRIDDPAQAAGKEIAAKQLLSLLGIGALGGFGVRGLMGMRDMTQDRQLPISASANLPRTISVFGKPQHPDVVDEQQAKPKLLPFNKLSSLGSLAAGAVNGVGQAVSDLPKTLAKILPDTHTTNPIATEWGIPAGMLALGGGAYGGYKLTDWLLNKEREMTGKNDVDAAEDDYHKALAEQYQSAMMAKGAGDDLGINDLADKYVAYAAEHGHGHVKQAFTMSALGALFPTVNDVYEGLPGMGHDNWQALKGGANAAALAAMLGTGKVTYDWAKGQNKQVLLRKALQRRQMMRQQMSPPPIVALPEEQSNNAA